MERSGKTTGTLAQMEQFTLIITTAICRFISFSNINKGLDKTWKYTLIRIQTYFKKEKKKK